MIFLEKNLMVIFIFQRSLMIFLLVMAGQDLIYMESISLMKIILILVQMKMDY